jgi:tryptophanyl-tRNA synthetase
MKPVLVSGVQPTGRLHVGNYLGALKNFVELQNSDKYQCYFFIADLHSLTEPFDPKEKQKQILNLAADFLAAGIDPKKSVIFLQSQIPAHSELAWILNTITPIGELLRMTQFKDKISYALNLNKLTESVQKLEKNISTEKYIKTNNELISEFLTNVGLFDYPVLMAADILLYGANVVPVGEDQLQHLELTRTLARKFNAKFGKTFVEPKDLLTKTPRVMSLKNPEKKMSKSQPESCLFIDDAPETIKEKIARATTDSGSEITYNPKTKPGLSNLLDIYAAISGRSIEAITKEFSGKNYSEFKKELTVIISDHFATYREKKKKLLGSDEKLKTILLSGSQKAAEVADKKIGEVKNKIGIVLLP